MTKTILCADHVLCGFEPDGTARIIADGAVVVEGDLIREIGDAKTLRAAHPEAATLGGRGHFLMPGMINAHHHVGLTPFQLGSADQPLELWFGSRLVMRAVNPRLDTLYSAFEMIASGVTTVQHLHSRATGGPEAVVATCNAVIGAYREIGMRASFSFALRDQNRMLYTSDEEFLALVPPQHRPAAARYLSGFPLTLQQQAEVFSQLSRQWQTESQIAIQLAPSNLHWLSDEALALTGQLARDSGAALHMHLMETPYQREYARRRLGGDGSVLRHLDQFGLIGPRLTIGHGVWMTPEDLDICTERGICICHNCSSNLRLKSGTLDLNAIMKRGIPVALGIDEAGINDDRDMLQEMRLVMTLHRPAGHDRDFPTGADVLRMATENGAATTGFSGHIGQIAPGMAADLVLLDWDRVTAPWQDASQPLADVLVRRARSGTVKTVMIAGQTVFDQGRFTRVDREEVLAQITRDLSTPETADEAERRRLAGALDPVIRRFYAGWLPAPSSSSQTE